MSNNTLSPASIKIASYANEVFPESQSNDVLFYIKNGSYQSIHIGHESNYGSMISILPSQATIRQLQVSNSMQVNADANVLGMTTTKHLYVNGTLTTTGNVVPTTQTATLGLPSKRFSSIYLGNNIALGSVSLSNNEHELSINANAIYGVSNGSELKPFYSWVNSSNSGMYLLDTDTIGISTSGTNRFYISSDGSIGIGTTTPSTKLHVAGNILTTGLITELSDVSCKENITPISNALSKVLSINGYSYTMKGSTQSNLGLLAQEVEHVFPELVLTSPDGIKSIAYSKMIAVIVEAIKELYSLNLMK